MNISHLKLVMKILNLPTLLSQFDVKYLIQCNLIYQNALWTMWYYCKNMKITISTKLKKIVSSSIWLYSCANSGGYKLSYKPFCICLQRCAIRRGYDFSYLRLQKNQYSTLIGQIDNNLSTCECKCFIEKSKSDNGNLNP